MNNSTYDDPLIEQLNKASKSLNIYLIVDGEVLQCIGRRGNEFYFGHNLAGTSFDKAQIYYFYPIDETSWGVLFEDY